MAKTTPPDPTPSAPSLTPKVAVGLLRHWRSKGQALLRSRPLDQGDYHAWEVATRNVLERAFGVGSNTVRGIMDIGKYGSRPLSPTDAWRENHRAESLARQLKAMEGLVELLDADIALDGRGELAGDAIGLSLERLHPEVRRVASRLVADGHYRQALIDAFIALDAYVQAASGVDLQGAPLMNTVFSQKSPVLRLSSKAEEQAGFMMLFAGAVKALRNAYAHKLVEPATADEALEWLGFASRLFHLVDGAERIDPHSKE